MITIVAGAKGGIGKSMVTLACYNFFTKSCKTKPLVIDADTSNPDVYKAVERSIEKSEKESLLHSIEIDSNNGWIDIVNEIEKASGNNILINTPARSNEGLIKYSCILETVLQELNQTLITIWPISRQRDSLELLKEYTDAFPDRIVHVIKNGFFGTPEKFTRYDESKLKKTIEGCGGKTLWIPDMADRVADEIYSARLTFEKALETMPIGNRAELSRWVALTDEALGQILL